MQRRDAMHHHITEHAISRLTIRFCLVLRTLIGAGVAQADEALSTIINAECAVRDFSFFGSVRGHRATSFTPPPF